MCGDPIRELIVEACEIAAPIIHSQWRGENHELPEYWMHFVVQPGRTIKIRVHQGKAEVTLSTLEGKVLGSVDITMGSRGVSYPFCDMQAIIVAAVSGARSEKEGDR